MQAGCHAIRFLDLRQHRRLDDTAAGALTIISCLDQQSRKTQQTLKPFVVNDNKPARGHYISKSTENTIKMKFTSLAVFAAAATSVSAFAPRQNSRAILSLKSSPLDTLNLDKVDTLLVSQALVWGFMLAWVMPK